MFTLIKYNHYDIIFITLIKFLIKNIMNVIIYLIINRDDRMYTSYSLS